MSLLIGSYKASSSGSKFVMLLLLVAALMLLSALFSYLVVMLVYGRGILGMLAGPDYSNLQTVHALKIIQVINMTGGILFPAAIYLLLADPETIRQLGERPMHKKISWLYAALLILAVQPFIGMLNEWNAGLKLPAPLQGVEQWMQKSESQAKALTEAFLSVSSKTGLLINLFMIAMLPALAEELLFRGALAGLFRQWTKSIHLAAIISSLLFAAVHLQFYGFMPRFTLGLLLAYLYLLTGNLWLPVLAHFINNGISVVAEFLFRNGYTSFNAAEAGTSQSVWVATGSVVVTLILFAWIRLSIKQEPVARGD